MKLLWILLGIVVIMSIILTFKLAGSAQTTTMSVASDLSLASDLYISYTDTRATFNWSTNQPAAAWLDFGTDASYGSNTEEKGSYSILHFIELNGLKPATVYHVRACSRNASGNTICSEDRTFTTQRAEVNASSSKEMAEVAVNNNLEDAFVIAWAPNRQQVAYIKYHGEGVMRRQDIFVCNADGSNEKQLTNREQEEYTALAWSPDGNKIAYVGTGANYNYMQLWVMYSDGSNLRHLTGGPSVDSIGGPLVWSIDGRWIAFGYSRYGSFGYGGYHTGQPEYSKNYDRRIIDIDGTIESPIP